MALELFFGCMNALDVPGQRLSPGEDLPALRALVLFRSELVQNVQVPLQRLLAFELSAADGAEAGPARRRSHLDFLLLARLGIHLDLDSFLYHFGFVAGARFTGLIGRRGGRMPVRLQILITFVLLFYFDLEPKNGVIDVPAPVINYGNFKVCLFQH